MDNRKEDDEIDLLKLFQALWRRAVYDCPHSYSGG